MRRPAAGRSPFSIHRAFVVQFRDETDAGHGRVAGRIEHVASRETETFQSWEEMKAFLKQVLGRIRENSSEASE